MRENHRQELPPLLASLLIVSIVSSFYWLAVDPLLGLVERKKAAMEINTAILKNYSGVAAEIKNLLAQYHSAPQLQEAVDTALPLNSDPDVAIAILGKMAEDSGFKIKALNLETGFSRDTSKIAVSIDGRGSYAQLRSFISAVEKSLRLMDVLQLSFRRSGEVKLEIAVYYQQLSEVLINNGRPLDPGEVINSRQFRERRAP